MKGAAAFALRTGTQLAKTGYEVIHFKETLTDAARDPIAAGKRVIRKGQFAVEDFRDEMVLAVRKQPLKSIGITCGIAFGIGFLTAWIGTRR